jgi:hypothetical protein
MSCESQDPPNVDTFEEDVINLWQLEMKGVSDEENFVLTDCERQSTIQFFEDGTFQRINYGINDEGVCVEFENITGTWEVDFKKGLGLTVNGETDFMSASVGVIDQETNTFSKKSNGNILRLYNVNEVNTTEEIYEKINE